MSLTPLFRSNWFKPKRASLCQAIQNKKQEQLKNVKLIFDDTPPQPIDPCDYKNH